MKTVIETLYGPFKIKEDEYYLGKECSDSEDSFSIGYYQKMRSGTLHESYELSGNLVSYKKVSRDLLFKMLRRDSQKSMIDILMAAEKQYLPEKVEKTKKKTEHVDSTTGLEVLAGEIMLPYDYS